MSDIGFWVACIAGLILGAAFLILKKPINAADEMIKSWEKNANAIWDGFISIALFFGPTLLYVFFVAPDVNPDPCQGCDEEQAVAEKQKERYDSLALLPFLKKQRALKKDGIRPEEFTINQYGVEVKSILNCAINEKRRLYTYSVKFKENGEEFRQLQEVIFPEDIQRRFNELSKSQFEFKFELFYGEKIRYRNGKLEIIKPKTSLLRKHPEEVFLLYQNLKRFGVGI